jgi:hypothetical protein
MRWCVFLCLFLLAACARQPSAELKQEIDQTLAREQQRHETYQMHNDVVLSTLDTLREDLQAQLSRSGMRRLSADPATNRRYEALMTEHGDLLTLHRAFLIEHQSTMDQVREWKSTFRAEAVTHQEAVELWAVYQQEFKKDRATEADIMAQFESWRSAFREFIEDTDRELTSGD